MGLQSLEREFEERLRAMRERNEGPFPPEGLRPDTAEVLRATDAVRAALREGFVEHGRAQSEILRVQQLTARGHMRQAVVESVNIRRKVAGFSDLNLDFVAEAVKRQERRQRRLITLGLVLAGGIILAATIIDLLRRANPH